MPQVNHTPNCVCVQCGRSFFAWPGELATRRFCCHTCYWDHMRGGTAEDRFWRDVDTRGECWEWTGALTPSGYGCFYAHGHTILAHRFSWELVHGPIPFGLYACHRCDNRPCVNPAHLFLGTHADNMADMAIKLRNAAAKVTPDIVRLIRARYAAGGITQRELAEEYGLGLVTINDMIRRKTWKHVA